MGVKVKSVAILLYDLRGFVKQIFVHTLSFKMTFLVSKFATTSKLEGEAEACNS